MYCYNIAAYRLAVLLGLDNVPMSVKRIVEETRGGDVVARRRDGRRRSPQEETRTLESAAASDYYGVMYVFDELIQNRDRNAGNIMWERDSKMWMIDHTRAFQPGEGPPESGQPLAHRALAVRAAARARRTGSAFTNAVKSVLTKDEIEALFIRRDKIVKRARTSESRRSARPRCSIRFGKASGQKAKVKGQRSKGEG